MDKIDCLMIRLRRTAGKGRGSGTTASPRRAMALLVGAIVVGAVSCDPQQNDSFLVDANGNTGQTQHCGYELTLKSGNGQEGLAGTSLPNEIVVRTSVTP